MSMRSPLRLAALIPIAAGAALLAGCGGAATSSGGSQPGAGSGGSSSGSINDGIGHAVNVCSIMPAATAATVSGLAITVAQEQDTPSYKLWVCNYTTADGTNGFTISVLALDAAPGYAADLQADGSAKPVSGLGDKAFAGTSGVEALFGNYSINVSNLESASASETLIRDVQSKI